MRHYSHLSYNDLEQIQLNMNGLPTEEKVGTSQGIKCPSCGKMNPLYIEMCECGLPTEIKNLSGKERAIESEIEARLEKKMEQFINTRLKYDRFMERFVESLLVKAKQSPVLLKTVSEIRSDLQRQNVKIPASHV